VILDPVLSYNLHTIGPCLACVKSTHILERERTGSGRREDRFIQEVGQVQVGERTSSDRT